MRMIFSGLLASVVLLASDAGAEDYFLTIGGGYSVTGNQLSLERNVVFQQSVLNRVRPDKPSHDIYFADGDDPDRDLQCRDGEFDSNCPRARRLMASLMGDETSMDLVYRNHEIEGETGPAEPKAIARRLRQLAEQLKGGDRLIIYATAHGGSAGPDYEYSWEYDYDEEGPTYNEYDTTLYMWDEEEISASGFVDLLDRLPKDVEVMLVMVQCYSGGFSHTIFNANDADLGLSSHLRCGFFSQVHDRPSAGCTPDIGEADYQEYSSFFWAALGGQTRSGEPITTADYNDDGVVSFAEAHAYAVIESDTIDIPIRTSGELLRKYSVLGKKKPGDDDDESSGLGKLFGMLGGGEDEESKNLVELQGSLSELVKLATPDEKAILEQLPGEIGLEGVPTVTAIKNRLEQIEAEETKAISKYAAAESKHSRAAERLVEGIQAEWPELTSQYAPMAMALCSERADEFVSTVESLPGYEAYVTAKERAEKLSDDHDKWTHLNAKAQRLLRTCENIVLAANLDKVAPEEIVARYERLRQMEEGTLAPPTSEPQESEVAEVTTDSSAKAK